MFTNNILTNLILNIKFYLNFENKLTHIFKIFINKFNLHNKIILNYIKCFKYNMFNFRNKVNFNKSKRNIMSSKKKIGHSRLGSSSSCILKKGLIWFGLRNTKLKKYKVSNNLLKYSFINNKNNLNINNLELYKFILNITSNNSNLYNKINNKNCENCIFINYVNNYINLLNKISFNMVY